MIRSSSRPPIWAFRLPTSVQSGLASPTIYGAQGTNTYLIETTGTGIAAFDYDGDGWLDIFQVNGSTLAGFPRGQEPTNHLYRNRHDGTFEASRRVPVSSPVVGSRRMRR
jgi:hypothetical protein